MVKKIRMVKTRMVSNDLQGRIELVQTALRILFSSIVYGRVEFTSEIDNTKDVVNWECAEMRHLCDKNERHEIEKSYLKRRLELAEKHMSIESYEMYKTALEKLV